jgi:hypothetical protein
MRLSILSALIAICALTSAAPKTNFNAQDDCVASLNNLIAATSSATSLTSKEQEGLLKIATDAQNLLLIGKTGDALTKLYDYQVKLNNLAATLSTSKPKISTSDEQVLRAALNEAIACISGG